MELDLVRLTRQLVDVESISGNEAAVARILAGELERLGLSVLTMPVEGERNNLFATWPQHPHPAHRILDAHGHGASVYLIFRRR